MVIKNKDINLFLFLFMIFTACIPYTGYGIALIRSGYIMVGAFSRNTDFVVTYSGGFGQLIAYLKDISCALLLFNLIMHIDLKKTSGKMFMIFFIIIITGIVVIVINQRIALNYLIAGVRCLMFVVTTIVFCQEYRKSIIESKFVKKVLMAMDITLLIQLIITVLQIQSSSSWSKFGSGAYRFCGAFPGSGNLGCYCIALQLLYYTINKKYGLIKSNGMILRSIVCIFLSVASGTRTTMFLCFIVFLFFITESLLKRFRFDFLSILVIVFILLLIIGIPVADWFINRTDRGELGLSGSGRVTLFFNMFDSANAFQLLFGRGLGIGTNIAVTLGMGKNELADSTINLIFIQYGLIGLGIFLAALLRIGYQMWIKTVPSIKGIVILFILVIAVMLFIGNLFEHIAMSIILIFTYYLIMTPVEEVANAGN